jgi:S1-C subfamily serine protease
VRGRSGVLLVLAGLCAVMAAAPRAEISVAPPASAPAILPTLAAASAPAAVPAPAAAPAAPAATAPAASAGSAAPPAAPAAPAAPYEPWRPYCSGEYADDLSALSPRAREFEDSQKRFTYCIRTTATYECPFYSSDGALKRARKRVVAHATGFGYRREGNDTLVVTNQHVSDWPAVTDEAHPLEGVPPGCKRMSDSLRIVDNESDSYERDDVALARVVTDPQLDLAVLKAKGPLPVVPWKVGRSAALRERNAVDVRGFPLGVLRANNVGKVTSAYEHDEEHEWDHDDFVIDALLSPGNSGSPVFAVSCRSGEFELVGVYHAGFVHGSALNVLNVVVAIDQARELLDSLRRPARPHAEGPPPLDAAARARVAEALRGRPATFFPFGPTIAGAVHRWDGALVLQVMGRDFPVRSEPVLVVEDLPPSDDGFGLIGRLWAGNGYGLRAVDRAALDAEQQAQLARIVDALRRDALLATAFEAAARAGDGTRERFEQAARLERSLRRLAEARQDLALGALELAERTCPGDADTPLTVVDALFVPHPGAPHPAPPLDEPAQAPEAAPPAAVSPATTLPPPGPTTTAATLSAEAKREPVPLPR